MEKSKMTDKDEKQNEDKNERIWNVHFERLDLIYTVKAWDAIDAVRAARHQLETQGKKPLHSEITKVERIYI